MPVNAPVSLIKGQNVAILDKTVLATAIATEMAKLATVTVGLSWDVPKTGSNIFDIDASAFLVKADGTVESNAFFVFYNNPSSPEGSVKHSGDNTTGEGEGFDETMTLDFTTVPESVDKIAIVVTIHGAEAKRQNFGQIPNASITVINDADKTEIAKYDLSEDASIATSVSLGEFYRHNDGWKFKAVGEGSEKGLAHFAELYSVVLA